jgi:ACS family sodium-dependent inorganic phosphate cotransporter
MISYLIKPLFLHHNCCFNNDETIITGISNSAGTLAAIISTIGTGYFVQWLGSFQTFLTITACLYVVTTIFWNLFATGDQVL